MVSDHQVRQKRSGDASKKVQLFKVGGSRIIGTAVTENREDNIVEARANVEVHVSCHRCRVKWR